MPLQWRSQIWQSLEEGAGKRCLECGLWGGRYLGDLCDDREVFKLQALVYDILPRRKVPESDARSVVFRVCVPARSKLQALVYGSLPSALCRKAMSTRGVGPELTDVPPAEAGVGLNIAPYASLTARISLSSFIPSRAIHLAFFIF